MTHLHDYVLLDLTLRPSWLERIRILFGASIRCQITVNTEHYVGTTMTSILRSDADLNIGRSGFRPTVVHDENSRI